MIISTPSLFDGAAFIGPAAVALADGRIERVWPSEIAAGVVLTAGHLTPGLIDVHNNGAFGVDSATADPAAFDRYIGGLTARGVTGVLPTIITSPLD